MWRGIKHSARLFRIGLTLARHDALFCFEELQVSPIITKSCSLLAKRSSSKLRPGERLATALEELGPTFIKLGQALSTRPDLVGEAIARDLTHLQDDIPPFDTAKARATIEETLEQSVEGLFESFDDEPVAAASIAQVHKAVTKDGRDVAVKVLRPNIEEAFARDTQLLLWLAEIADARKPEWKRLKLIETIETFINALKFELDLRYEASAGAEFAENMEAQDGIYVPKIDWQRTSEKVLTTEWIDGIPINDLDAIEQAGIDRTLLVEHAANAFFHQVFQNGFFHADMHPGNIFVLPDSRLAVVDFGIMGRVDRKSQIYIAEILWGFLKEDYVMVAQRHIDAGYVPADQPVELFAQACRAIAKPILDKPLNEISIGRLLGQLFQVAETFQMETQPQLLLLQKTMMLAEGVGRSLNPNVNMWKLSEPLIMQWVSENMTPQARIKHNVIEGIEAIQHVPNLIKKGEAILERVQTEGFELHPKTVRLLSQSRRTQRQWLWFAWGALFLLVGIFVIELSLINWD
ncbi:MAG: 2-polyprenylphenol 6-hydroxylase [Rickettsiales bacterium]|nr:2-polyprenylphenol 6-hydroxylase [Rickettsiales bacterium]